MCPKALFNPMTIFPSLCDKQISAFLLDAHNSLMAQSILVILVWFERGENSLSNDKIFLKNFLN
jgi:hypothetical protein